jgi:hypothetical protein
MTAYILVVCLITCTPVDPEHLTRAQCERYADQLIAAGQVARCVKAERGHK